MYVDLECPLQRQSSGIGGEPKESFIAPALITPDLRWRYVPMADFDFGKVREYGKRIDFGKTANDYGRYRAGLSCRAIPPARNIWHWHSWPAHAGSQRRARASSGAASRCMDAA